MLLRDKDEGVGLALEMGVVEVLLETRPDVVTFPCGMEEGVDHVEEATVQFREAGLLCERLWWDNCEESDAECLWPALHDR